VATLGRNLPVLIMGSMFISALLFSLVAFGHWLSLDFAFVYYSERSLSYEVQNQMRAK
jgi:hypothetical protein